MGQDFFVFPAVKINYWAVIRCGGRGGTRVSERVRSYGILREGWRWGSLRSV